MKGLLWIIKVFLPREGEINEVLVQLSHQHSMGSTLKNLFCFAIFNGYFLSGWVPCTPPTPSLTENGMGFFRPFLRQGDDRC